MVSQSKAIVLCVGTIFLGTLAGAFTFLVLGSLGTLFLGLLGFDDSMMALVVLLALLVAAVIIAVHIRIALTLWTRLRKPVPGRGVCIRCGYDLRGNTSAHMCPECGKWQYIPKANKPDL
jgi:hypothetical protein